MKHIQTFKPGDKARVCIAIEHDGCAGDDDEIEYTVKLVVGQVVVIAQLQQRLRNAETGEYPNTATVTAPDIHGVDRTFTVDTEVLASVSLM